jgi:hypothetical protein
VNRMTRMGPEALLVQQKMSPRSGMAEYARLEYVRVDRRSVEAGIRLELEYLPSKRPAAQRFVRWGRELFRRDEARAPVIAAVRPTEPEVAWGHGAPVRSGSSASLAAVPALRAGVCAEGEPKPISALPVFGRA